MLLGLGRGQSATGPRAADGRCSRRSLLAAGAAAVAGWCAPPLAAGEADASTRARDDALRALPLADLTAESRRKLLAVTENPSLFRRLPQNQIDCDPGLYLFLVRNPEVVVNIWQVMGISAMTAERQGPYLWKGNDGAGTTCDVELIYGTSDLHIIYSDGFYEGSLLKRKLTGRCVLLLKSDYLQSADRRWRVASRLDVFLQVDNMAADVVTRTLSPWVGKAADTNFHESCLFVSRLSQAAEQNGAGVQRLSDKLTSVDPPVREEFTRVAASVQQRAALRDVGAPAKRS
jgi:hypothetical protein